MGPKIPFTDYIKERIMKHRSAYSIHKELVKDFGEKAPSYRTVKQWAALFKAARDGCEDEPGFNDHAKIDKKYRLFIKKRVGKKTLKKIFREMRERFGEESPCLSTVAKWTHRIRFARDGFDAIPQLPKPSIRSVVQTSVETTAASQNQVNSRSDAPDVPYVKLETIDESLITTDSASLPMRYFKMPPNHGFDRQLEPEKITDIFSVHEKRYFAIKWKNSDIDDLG